MSVITTIGTRSSESINVFQESSSSSSSSATGDPDKQYFIELSTTPPNTVVGDVLTDSNSKTFLIVEINGAFLTLRDFGQTGVAPASGTGSTARAYSTLTAYEADLDDTIIFDSGDDSEGRIYNDSVFDESIVVNGGATVGLGSIKLSVASGQRHDGTAGTGARIVRTSGGSIIITLSTNDPLAVEWLEIDLNGNDAAGAVIKANGSTVIDQHTVSKLIIHDKGGGTVTHGVQNDNRQLNTLNCIVYDFTASQDTGADQIGIRGDDDKSKILNNTIFKFDRTDNNAAGASYGIRAEQDSVNTEIKNNIVCDVTKSGGAGDVAGFSFVASVNLTSSNNLSSDATADDAGGTGHLLNKTSANQFVSTVDGSEDLHLKTDADAIGVGTDLGTTPTGVNIDINGSDRDVGTDTVWDMGAHQYEQCFSVGTSSRDYTTHTAFEADLDNTAIYGAGARACALGYNDSVFDEVFAVTGGATVGLNGIRVSVADGERHDGTAGTGARIVRTTLITVLLDCTFT